MFFSNVAAKYLSSVEVDSWTSNQHEFNGVAQLRKLFGNKRQYLIANFMYYDNNGIKTNESVNLTWYDARENDPYRTEYRLYYTDNCTINMATPNDLLVIGKQDNGKITVIIAKYGCPYCNLLLQMLGIPTITTQYVILNGITLRS